MMQGSALFQLPLRFGYAIKEARLRVSCHLSGAEEVPLVNCDWQSTDVRMTEAISGNKSSKDVVFMIF